MELINIFYKIVILTWLYSEKIAAGQQYDVGL